MVRIKQLWTVYPLPQHLKLMWTRLTSSRLATFYLVMTIANALIQVTLQFTAHTVNSNAAVLMNELVEAGGMQSRNFTLYDHKAISLRSCWGIPGEGSGQSCTVVWAKSNSVIKPNGISYSIGEESANVSSADAASTSASSSSSDYAVSTSSTPTPTPSSPPIVSASLSPASTTIAEQVSSSTAATPTAFVNVVSGKKDDDDDDDEEEEDDNGGISLTTTIVFVGSPAPSATSNTIVPQGVRRKRSVTVAPLFSSENNTSVITGLQIHGLTTKDGSDLVDISLQCVSVLRWPLQKLQDTQREDIVLLSFQIWVLGMSIVALLNESIPHIVAALLTHLLATMWSGYQLANTQEFKTDFVNLTSQGACDGVNLLPQYWKERGVAEISLLVLNCVALVASALLSWKIVKAFGWATFRRIGADRNINRIYTIVLMMSIFLQLSVFFIVTSMALWIDQLCFGSIGRFSEHMMIYRVIDIVIFFILIPWLALGWFGVRRENKKMTYAFIGISVFLLGQWASEFVSAAWRLTFVTWDFFALMSVVAAVLTIVVTILGIVCLRHFGAGLPSYLKPEEHLIGEDFQRVTPPTDVETGSRLSDASLEEKVAFPDMGRVPTYEMPFTQPRAAPVPPRTTAPTAMTESVGPRPLMLPAQAKLQTRRESANSTSSRESDTDPFYMSDRLSGSSVSQSSQKKSMSRWSKDSSADGGKRVAGLRKPTVLVKRWVIE